MTKLALAVLLGVSSFTSVSAQVPTSYERRVPTCKALCPADDVGLWRYVPGTQNVCELNGNRCSVLVRECTDTTYSPCGQGLSTNAGPWGNAIPAANSYFHEGMPAWDKLPGATLYDFPKHYLGGRFLSVVPDSTTAAQGSHFEYYCPKSVTTACDIVVFLYECYPCESKKGGLPAHLVSEGYERSRCAPQFTTGTATGLRHRMSAFIKKIQPGQFETVTMQGETEFMFSGMSYESVDCPAFQNPLQCEANAHRNFCQFKSGLCDTRTCIVTGFPGCDTATCVKQDLPLP